MKKKIAIFITLFGMALGCVGCTHNAKDNSAVDSETGVGSFQNIDVTYNNKYNIEFTSETAGHPGGGADYCTNVGWKNEQGHGSCSVYYYVKSDNNIEDDYDGYNELEEATIADKTYKVIREDNKLTLLYKIDDSIYVQVEVFGMQQFNDEGSSVDVTYTVSNLLDDGCLDGEVSFKVTII